MENKDIIAAKYVAEIIVKKINHIRLTTNEVETLDNWINKSEKRRLHYDQLLNGKIDIENIDSFKESVDKNCNAVIKKVKDYNRQNRRRRYFIAVASFAAVLALLFTSIPQRFAEVANLSILSQNEVIVDLDTEIYLVTNGKKQIIAETENRLPIVINEIPDTMSEIKMAEEMNTLVVPKCKSYKMKLNDGTMIWINASSRINFPTVFADDKRVVEVEGEVYFDVVRDEKRPFIVKTKKLAMEVLGTRFLVSSYNDSDVSTVSLVSGSVKVNAGKESHLLAAGRGVNYNAVNNILEECDINVKKIEGLLENKFLFLNETLDDIVKEISRWYGVDIAFEDETMRDLRFFMRTNKTDNLEELMTLISYTNNLKYQLKNNLLTIKTNKKYE